MLKATEPYQIKPPEPKVVSKDYTQGVDNLTSDDFLKIYMETLRYQDPFEQKDFSKMLEDMARLNEIKHFNDIRNFLEGLKGWFNQMTFLSSLSLIGKDFVFSAQDVDTLKGGEYFLLSSEDLKGVSVKLMDGEDVVKEYKLDIKRGLNTLDLSDLPKGRFGIKIFKDGVELGDVALGYRSKVVSVSILKGELFFELENGRLVSPSSIIHSGGV
ncbi:MAG: flagellar hook assembly protein FlgD [Acidobacteria bacterium]|nr:MAG: flagellar hook assembly protein FlgD [Acidobacteriota bacterium]